MRCASVLVAAAVAYALLAAAVFRPSPSELAHTLPAYGGSSADALLLTWATSHVSRTVTTRPLELFDGGVFHPAADTLAFGDHMIGQAILGLPVWWATHNPLLEYNLLALGSYVTGATAAFAFLRHGLGLAPWAAFAGGVVFAFTPYRYRSPLWLQLLWTAVAPLALLAWLRFVHTLRAAWWGAWVLCWALHSLMGMYLTLYFAIVMGVLGALALGTAPTRRDPRLWAGTVGAPIATLLLVAPTLWPYVTLRRTQGNVRPGGIDTPLSFLLPDAGTATGRLFGFEDLGGFGPGLVAWALIALGAVAVGRTLWAAHRAAQADDGQAAAADRAGAGPAIDETFAWWSILVGLAAVLLLVFAPIRLQHEIPGLDMIRNTNRAFFIGLLFLGALAARGLAVVTGTSPGRRLGAAAGALATIALCVDTGTPPSERKRYPVGAELSSALQFLADLPDGSVVYERRHGPEGLTVAMYHAIFHRKRIPNGYSGFIPPGAAFANHILFRFPDPQSLRLMTRLGVDFVWVPLERGDRLGGIIRALDDTPVRLVERFGAGGVFDVRAPLAEPPTARRTRPIPPTAWRLDATDAVADLPSLQDGDPETIWRHPPPRGGVAPSLTIDLGADHPLAGVSVRVSRDVPALPYLARIAVSRDGRAWTSLDAGFLPEPFAELFTAPPPILTFVARFPTRRARFVRLTVPELLIWAAPWHIGELAILEDTGL